MSRTYTWSSEAVGHAGLFDGVAQVFNTADGQVEVLEVIVDDASGAAGSAAGTLATAFPGAFSIDRITAHTLGDGVVAAVKHDTNASDLPAEVVCFQEPSEVVASDLLRQLSDCPVLSTTVAVAALGARLPSGPLAPGGSRSCTMLRAGSSPIEPLVLREGEGFAVRQGAAGTPRSLDLRLTVNVVGTSRSYRFRVAVGTTIVGRALLSLFNGVGSGVVLEVRDICGLETGEVVQPSVRLVRTEGYQGDLVPTFGSATSCDTLAPLPSSVQLMMGPFLSRLPGTEVGVPYEWFRTHGSNFSIANQQLPGTLRVQTRSVLPQGPGVASAVPSRSNTLWKCKSGQCGIILRRNEGLSVLLGRAGVIDTSSLNLYTVRFIFTYTPRAVLNPLRGTVVSAA